MSTPDPVPNRTWSPNGAVGAGVLAGAVVGVLVWAAQSFFHVAIPDYVQGYLMTIGTGVGMWIHPAGRIPKA